jgi:hypothetical protein
MAATHIKILAAGRPHKRRRNAVGDEEIVTACSFATIQSTIALLGYERVAHRPNSMCLAPNIEFDTSETVPTKEEEFKQRFVAVLKDLQAGGKDDIEAMWLLGNLASAIVEKTQKKSWPALKADITRELYDSLLNDFQVQGNALHQRGEAKKAYAIQILGISLIARTQLDPQLQTGAALLDEIIDYATLVYRKNRHLEKPLN